MVLLTPGPSARRILERYLARYLGVTLVEGGDLVVRDQRVWREDPERHGKRSTSSCRRLDDDFLDPLELRA